jgi:hypothetical protein
MTWISDLAMDAREEDNRRERREDAYTRQMGGVE